MGAATGCWVMATEVSWEPIGGTVATAKGLDNPAVTSWKTKKTNKKTNLQPFCMGKYPKLSLFCCAGAKNPELGLGLAPCGLQRWVLALSLSTQMEIWV